MVRLIHRKAGHARQRIAGSKGLSDLVQLSARISHTELSPVIEYGSSCVAHSTNILCPFFRKGWEGSQVIVLCLRRVSQKLAFFRKHLYNNKKKGIYFKEKFLLLLIFFYLFNFTSVSGYTQEPFPLQYH